MLVIEGALLRQHSEAGRNSSEVLCRGDAALITPPASHPFSYIGLTRGLVALIDVAALCPADNAAILERLQRQRDLVLFQLGLTRLPKAEDRVEELLWHLAERLGTRSEDAGEVRLRLSQRQIGALVGAHRTSINAALGRLQDAGRVRRRLPYGWIVNAIAAKHSDAGSDHGEPAAR